MADPKSKLYRDPNIPASEYQFAENIGRNARNIRDIAANSPRALAALANPLGAPALFAPDAYNYGTKKVKNVASGLQRGYDNPTSPSAPAAAPVNPAAPSAKTAPKSALAPDEQSAIDGYLGARKELAPGVLRYNRESSDPSQIYITTDKNGNRVYTDSAKFAAGMSSGRALRRQDFAPGAAASDVTATLNNPEGHFQYADAPTDAAMKALENLAGKDANNPALRRALDEASLSRGFEATRAGTREIDKARAKEGARLHAQLFPDEAAAQAQNAPSLRDLLAIKNLGLNQEKFDYQQKQDKATADAANQKAQIQLAKDLAGLLDGVRNGTSDPAAIRDLISNLPGDQAKGAAYGLRRALLQSLLKNRDAIGLGPDEVNQAQPTSVHWNPDGSATYVEPDSGLFDLQRNISLSPEDLIGIYGLPDAGDAARKEELKTRQKRGL